MAVDHPVGRPKRDGLPRLHPNGRYGARSARSPLARTCAEDSALDQSRAPVARAIQVSASISTTAGGVPRVWRTPSTTCTAAYGGTRTSTDFPGARVSSSARKCLVSRRRSAGAASPASRRARASATAAGSAGRRRAGMRRILGIRAFAPRLGVVGVGLHELEDQIGTPGLVRAPAGALGPTDQHVVQVAGQLLGLLLGELERLVGDRAVD